MVHVHVHYVYMCIMHINCIIVHVHEDEYQEVSVPRSGRRKGVAPGQATKHDPKLCGQKNVRNMEKVIQHLMS